MTTTAAVNANDDGRGSPVVVRVYQLASRASFEGADFYQLYTGDAATLGPDLIKKDEFLLAPGSTKSLTLTPTDAVKAIGVFAAYRAFQEVTWRAAADLPPHQTTDIAVTADKPGLTLTSKPASP